MKKCMLFLVAMMMSILLSACMSTEKSDPIVLPEEENVISISLSDNNATATCTDREQIGEILSILMDMESTSKLSVNDSPGVDDYIKIELYIFQRLRLIQLLLIY